MRVCPKNGLSCAHYFFTSIPPWLVGPTPRQRTGCSTRCRAFFPARRFKAPWTAERIPAAMSSTKRSASFGSWTHCMPPSKSLPLSGYGHRDPGRTDWPRRVSVAGDIADAGTALAGLILVYLGAVAVRYETLDPTDQSSARDVYRRHARRAFRGVVIALVAAIAALTAKSLKSEPYATIIAAMACLALLMSFFIAAMSAYGTLKSID